MTDIADTRPQSTAPGWEGILDQGERIVWQGRPDPGLHFGPGQLGTALFSVFFSGFAVFWMVMASRAGGAFWMFGLIHFSVGIAMFWKAIVGATFRRRHTWYTLTDRRAFIATDLPFKGKRLQSYPITPDTRISLAGGPLSTIHFAREERRGNKGRHYMVDIGFERIEDGEKVAAILRRVQRGGAAA